MSTNTSNRESDSAGLFYWLNVHYYKRNLGDYAKKAGRLSMLQHGSYTLLLDACYDREQFPTMEQALEWTWASTPEEIDAVKLVLSRFFVLSSEGVYIQERVLEELLDYQSKADKNKQIAIERETKRAEKRTNRAPFVNGSSPEQHEPPPNHKPITINQEPSISSASASRTAPKTVDKSVSEKPSSTVWASYALAYSTRYGSEPPRNAKVNAHCKQLIDRVGAEDAPRLAAWYVKNENLPFYVSRGHPMDSLVKDCEGMLVRMRNGQAMTTREAVDVDRRSGDEITIRNAVDKSQGLTRLPIQAEYQRLPEALI